MRTLDILGERELRLQFWVAYKFPYILKYSEFYPDLIRAGVSFIRYSKVMELMNMPHRRHDARVIMDGSDAQYYEKLVGNTETIVDSTQGRSKNFPDRYTKELELIKEDIFERNMFAGEPLSISVVMSSGSLNPDRDRELCLYYFLGRFAKSRDVFGKGAVFNYLRERYPELSSGSLRNLLSGQRLERGEKDMLTALFRKVGLNHGGSIEELAEIFDDEYSKLIGGN